MKCVYINLDSAQARREAIEANFARHAAPGWTLRRFAALDAAHVESKPVPGKATPQERACFASHRAVIAESQADEGHLFVLEDDSLFCARTCRLVDKALAANDRKAAHLFAVRNGCNIKRII